MKKVYVFFGFLFAALFLSQTGLFPQNGNGADESPYTEAAAPETAGGETTVETPQLVTTGAVPQDIRRPQRGETPRYPRDMIIGELGRGQAPQEAWLLAREFLRNLVQGSVDAAVLARTDSALVESSMEALDAVGGVKFRIGGGKIEDDGSVSFLIRFIGRELSITGELYLRQREAEPEEEVLEEAAVEEGAPAVTAPVVTAPAESAAVAEEGAWYIDDLLLEEPRDLSAQREAYRYDFSPYERFY
ncbi:MAG: hypothetical protein LBF78_14000 [Treponema sp.]|jgi:hypothetical protein|nr:hypothetical protein [Treponema sp.]